jgi:hypothetical protein
MFPFGTVLLPIMTSTYDGTAHFDFKSVVKQRVKRLLLKRSISEYADLYRQYSANCFSSLIPKYLLLYVLRNRLSSGSES